MKINKIIMAVIMIFGLLFIPNVYAAEDIVIKSIKPISSSDNATYDENPTVNGLTISFKDITFKDAGDFVKYKIIITNNSNDDYKIVNDTSFSKSNYFKYVFESDSDNTIVSKNSTKEMEVTILYNKDVPEDELDDNGTFSETNNMTINLTNDTPTNNPKTGSGVLILLVFAFIVAVASISVIISNKTKLNKHFIMIIALSLAIIPVTIYAAKLITINLDTKISIDKNYHFYFADYRYSCSEPVDLNDFMVAEGYRVDFINDECVNDHWVEEYSYAGADVTWRDVFEYFEYDDYMINAIYKDNELKNNVKLTDTLINGHTYYFYNEPV